MGTYIIIAIPLLIIPAIFDIPYVIAGKYDTMPCKTISHDNVGDVVKLRSIQVININNNKMIELKVNYTAIQNGENYTINYLPHLRIGKIVSEH